MGIPELNTIWTERVNEMLKEPKINEVYQSHRTAEEAKEWIYNQALLTLIYSHEERVEMARKKGLHLRAV